MIEQTLDIPLHLATEPGHYIAYLQQNSKQNKRYCIVFLSGFMSDMTGTKATAMADFCQEEDIPFIRFDYFGHGQSTGQFTDGTISRWLSDTLAIIDMLPYPEIIIVGSSMGGWLMLLAALARPKRIHGLIGIASAPDFTETLIWDMLKSDQQLQLMQTGLFELPAEYCSGSYPVTKQLIEDGRKHLLMGAVIAIHCKITLLHGMNDKDVPYMTSVYLAERLASDNITTILLKDGDHRMAEAAPLAALRHSVREMIHYVKMMR